MRRCTRLLAQLCELYNMALQQRRNAYRELRVSVNYLNQQTQLTELRGGIEEYAEFSCGDSARSVTPARQGLQSVLPQDQEREKPGFPRFRSRDRYDSFNVPSGSFSFSDGMLKLARLGTFRTKTKCKIKGNPSRDSCQALRPKVAGAGCMRYWLRAREDCCFYSYWH